MIDPPRAFVLPMEVLRPPRNKLQCAVADGDTATVALLMEDPYWRARINTVLEVPLCCGGGERRSTHSSELTSCCCDKNVVAFLEKFSSSSSSSSAANGGASAEEENGAGERPHSVSSLYLSDRPLLPVHRDMKSREGPSSSLRGTALSSGASSYCSLYEHLASVEAAKRKRLGGGGGTPASSCSPPPPPPPPMRERGEWVSHRLLNACLADAGINASSPLMLCLAPAGGGARTDARRSWEMLQLLTAHLRHHPPSHPCHGGGAGKDADDEEGGGAKGANDGGHSITNSAHSHRDGCVNRNSSGAADVSAAGVFAHKYPRLFENSPDALYRDGVQWEGLANARRFVSRGEEGEKVDVEEEEEEEAPRSMRYGWLNRGRGGRWSRRRAERQHRRWEAALRSLACPPTTTTSTTSTTTGGGGTSSTVRPFLRVNCAAGRLLQEAVRWDVPVVELLLTVVGVSPNTLFSATRHRRVAYGDTPFVGAADAVRLGQLVAQRNKPSSSSSSSPPSRCCCSLGEEGPGGVGAAEGSIQSTITMAAAPATPFSLLRFNPATHTLATFAVAKRAYHLLFALAPFRDSIRAAGSHTLLCGGSSISGVGFAAAAGSALQDDGQTNNSSSTNTTGDDEFDSCNSGWEPLLRLLSDYCERREQAVSAGLGREVLLGVGGGGGDYEGEARDASRRTLEAIYPRSFGRDRPMTGPILSEADLIAAYSENGGATTAPRGQGEMAASSSSSLSSSPLVLPLPLEPAAEGSFGPACLDVLLAGIREQFLDPSSSPAAVHAAFGGGAFAYTFRTTTASPTPTPPQANVAAAAPSSSSSSSPPSSSPPSLLLGSWVFAFVRLLVEGFGCDPNGCPQLCRPRRGRGADSSAAAASASVSSSVSTPSPPSSSSYSQQHFVDAPGVAPLLFAAMSRDVRLFAYLAERVHSSMLAEAEEEEQRRREEEQQHQEEEEEHRSADSREDANSSSPSSQPSALCPLSRRLRDVYFYNPNDTSKGLNVMHNRFTPFVLASDGGTHCVEIFRLLAERYQLDPRRRYQDSWTVLHNAARGNAVAIIKYIVSTGCDLHTKTVDTATYSMGSEEGSTPLHSAALYGHREAFEALLDGGGACMDAVDAHGDAPIDAVGRALAFLARGADGNSAGGAPARVRKVQELRAMLRYLETVYNRKARHSL